MLKEIYSTLVECTHIITMGFSFRGKGSSQPELDGQSSGHDISAGEAIDINPEADLKKFKKLHKWDPFMDIDKLDAADEFVTLFPALSENNFSIFSVLTYIII